MGMGDRVCGARSRKARDDMSWKYVLNVNVCMAKDRIEASVIAENAGYQFFLYRGVVYFRDSIGRRTLETNILEKDLF